MGNYEITFIYKIFLEYSNHKGEEYYKMKANYKDTKMLKLTLKVRSKPIKKRIYTNNTSRFFQYFTQVYKNGY